MVSEEETLDPLGFKQITHENWLQPDPVNALFVGTLDQFLAAMLAPQLAPTVALDVLKLFEVARSMMVYGYLFYPLYTVAAEHLYRIGEAAVRHKCSALGAPKAAKMMAKQVDWLAAQGVFSEKEENWWRFAKDSRNFVSHLDQQSLLPPGVAISLLSDMASRINALFA